MPVSLTEKYHSHLFEIVRIHRNENMAYKNAHKNARKSSKTFKSSLHYVVSTGENFAKNMSFYVPLAVLSSHGKVLWENVPPPSFSVTA